MAVAWATSPAYGSVVLGPVQRDVLRVALGMTRSGRRPLLTLHRLAELTGRPVSSVHAALGRLRALGLLGVSVRMGRRGGHRLWRVDPRSAQLDTDRHRRAIARILGRYGARRVVPLLAVPPERDPRPDRPPSPAGDTPPPLDPFSVKPSDWTPPRDGESFTDRLRRNGLSPSFLADHERLHRDKPRP